MTTYVALLRAVNVGGHGKLAMRDLVQLCEKAGFAGVRTYIASGNAVFRSELDARTVKATLEAALQVFTGALVPVMIRSSGEIEAAWQACPFHEALGNQVAVTFLDAAPPRNAIDTVTAQVDEQMALGVR